MHTASIPRTAPLALWRVAEAFLHILHALFGAPEDVAREHTLSRAAYALMLSWLRVGEALLRRLLVIEAAVFDKPGASRARAPRQRQRKRMEFTADNPEDWRVSFRCFLGDTHARQADRRNEHNALGACVSPKKRFHSAWPIAERYEALLRVFNAPYAFARRLAHRLRSNPRALDTVLIEPEHYATRIDDAEALTAAARKAWRDTDSS